MEIKTYDTILNELCNDFDKVISPNKISRTNSNIIYLLLKAISKGIEVLHNTFVFVNNKFDPEKCLDEDLVSVAKLVGTNRLQGSASGLELIIKNRTEETVIFPTGTYTYKLNDTDIFQFKQYLPEEITAEKQFITKIAISTTLKAIPVTAQNKIKLEGKTDGGLLIDLSKFEIDCKDNAGLLGTVPETNIDFRNRIVRGSSSASLFDRLREEIANLPYIFDCQLQFNNSTGDKMVGDIRVPPYHLLVIISGTPDDKVAEIIASHGTFETVNVPLEGKVIKYKNDIFIDGEYPIYYIKPRDYKYSIKIYYEADEKAITDTTVEKAFEDALIKFKNTNVYKPLITEREFSNYLMSLGLPSVQILNVDLIDAEGQTKDYIKLNPIQLAQLNSFTAVNASTGEK